MNGSNQFVDKKAIQKEVWKDKQTYGYGKYSLKKRFLGGDKRVKKNYSESPDPTSSLYPTHKRKFKGYKED